MFQGAEGADGTKKHTTHTHAHKEKENGKERGRERETERERERDEKEPATKRLLVCAHTHTKLCISLYIYIYIYIYTYIYIYILFLHYTDIQCLYSLYSVTTNLRQYAGLKNGNILPWHEAAKPGCHAGPAGSTRSRTGPKAQAAAEPEQNVAGGTSARGLDPQQHSRGNGGGGDDPDGHVGA